MESNIISFRKFLLVVFLGVISFFIYFYFVYNNKLTTLVFCNVGQGDGIYLRIKNRFDLVIDAGPDKSILRCLGRYMPFWDKKIELVILTHPNKDHYYGFFYLINRYQIEKFITVEKTLNSKIFNQLIKLIKNKKIKINYVYVNDFFYILNKNIKINFLWPPKNLNSANDNDYSLVFLYQEKGKRVLFTGDASNYVLNRLSNQLIKNIDILKIPHHGSKNSLTKKFLLLANPKISVISVGKNNSYGHPAKKVLEMLKAQGTKIKRTDEEGEIVFKF